MIHIAIKQRKKYAYIVKSTETYDQKALHTLIPWITPNQLKHPFLSVMIEK